MARLAARIIRLERRLPAGREAKLRALSEEDLVRRIAELMGVSEAEVREMSDEELALCRDQCLRSMSEDEVRDMVRKCPRLQNELARWRALQDDHTREAQHDDAAAPDDSA